MKKIILIPSYEPDDKLIKLVKKIDQEEFKIVVVDDGSGKDYKDIFKETEEYAKVISYEPNKGKGHALKTGYKYIKETFKNDYIVITVDSDGQHRIEDAEKLCRYIEKNPESLALGMRIRNEKTPIRSKIGNSITKFVYRITTGLNVYDTQTGLRAFSDKLMDLMLEISGERFEYEMNVLLICAKKRIDIHEIKIETIYIENNAHSHFNTIKDSYLVYKEIIKFSLSSIISFIVDYLLFSIFTIIGLNITLSTIIARILSATLNFTINKNIVFKSQKNTPKALKEYALLAIVVLILNVGIINLLALFMNKYIAKLITEIILFAFSLTIQKLVIFKKDNNSV